MIKCPKCNSEITCDNNINLAYNMCEKCYNKLNKIDNSNIREFSTGSNRDIDTNKPDFEGALSPLVISAYGDYIVKHRKIANGTLRSDDNWQLLFGEKHCDVCIKSAWRHFLDFWKEHRGYKSRDGLDEAICGLLFNVMAYYHKVLIDREKGELK